MHYLASGKVFTVGNLLPSKLNVKQTCSEQEEDTEVTKLSANCLQTPSGGTQVTWPASEIHLDLRETVSLFSASLMEQLRPSHWI